MMPYRAQTSYDRVRGGTLGEFDETGSGEPGPGVPSSEARETPTKPKEEAPESFPGERLLSGPTARDVLRRVVEGDPLGLQQKVVTRLREGFLFLDGSRVLLRAMAHTARAAMVYKGTPPLEEWLTQIVERSVREHVEEDREAARLSLPPNDPVDGRFTALSGLLGIEVGEARRVCVFLNDLPLEKRRVFRALFAEGQSLASYAEETGDTPADIRRTLREVLRRLSWLAPDFKISEDLFDE